MIQTVELVKTFDDFRALDALNIYVPKGAVYGLVGPNGAGKTTLIRHLTGAQRQSAGEVRIDAQPVWENAALKSRIACIPDDIYYFPQASIRDMLRFYRAVYPTFDMARFTKLRGAFALDEKMPLRRMSRGMKKQAAFWLELCRQADVLLLDEPVDGLDPVMRRQVWSLLMADIAEKGTTVLISSHNLRELEDVCDHVGIMYRGKMLAERSLEQMQGTTVKIQLAFDTDTQIPAALRTLHHSQTGRVHTLIMQGERQDIIAKVKALSPLFMETIPLSLEEIFIHELGGAGYAVHEILL